MNYKFFITFVIVTIISEIMISLLLLVPKANKIRKKGYSKTQTTVTARQVGQWTRDHNRFQGNRFGAGRKPKAKSAGRDKYISTKYEWEYNEKKYHKVFRSTSYPSNMQRVITINKRTGKYQSPKGETKIGILGVLTFIISVIIGLIAAGIICG